MVISRGETGETSPDSVTDASASSSHARHEQDPTLIRTPDQRLRVFVSSTLHELAGERLAAQKAIRRLRLTPVLFELGARSHPPRLLYRAYLDQSDIFIGIYWERYGWVAPGEEISGLEDEYGLAGGRPKLIYVKSPAPAREPRLEALLQRIQDDDTACYRSFQTAAELRELIENDLAVLLTERFAVRRPAPSPAEAEAGAGDTLPVPRGRLIDRTAELAAIRQLLLDREVGLVTLIGPGGSGKSRLALHAAATLRRSFADGVYFVPLEPITDTGNVLPAVARAMGILLPNDPGQLEQTAAHIGTKRMLLVLDNFEHLLAAGPLVADLLARCPQLKVLATSRAPLHVRGERETSVLPLETPGLWGSLSHVSLESYPAVELFVERAREVKPTFDVTDETAPVIAEICQRLDGLPLAIELAAARIKALPPRALLARLERRLPLLTGGARDLPARQQTLRQAIGWSYDLLDERQQALFRHLAVFVGGFNFEAAEAICGAHDNDENDGTAPHQPAKWNSSDVLAGVEALLDMNLLWMRETAGGEPRFDMLQTIREYGLEALAARGEEAEVRDLHAAWGLALVEQAAPELIGPEQDIWMARLDDEHANLRAALTWLLAVEKTADKPLRLGAALWRYWWSRGYAREGQQQLSRALALPGLCQPSIRARGLVAAAELAETLADYEHAEHWHQEGIALYRSLHDEAGEAASLNGLGIVLRAQGALDRAEALHEEALAILRRLDDQRGIATTLNNLGAIAYVRGDVKRAGLLWEETLALLRRLGDRRSVSALLSNLGVVARNQGNVARAIALHDEALAIARSLGDRQGESNALANLASAFFAHGDLEKATTAFEEALASSRELGEVSSEAVILHDLGKLAEAQSDLSAAAERFAESLRLLQQVKRLPEIATVLECFGSLAQQRDAPVLATRLFGAAAGIREATGAAREHSESEHHMAEARAKLGEAGFAEAWAAGCALSLDQAITEALASASPR